MGIAYDAQCENENLKSRLRSKTKKMAAQKKQLKDLSENVLKYFSDEGNCTAYDLENQAKKILKNIKN